MERTDDLLEPEDSAEQAPRIYNDININACGSSPKFDAEVPEQSTHLISRLTWISAKELRYHLRIIRARLEVFYETRNHGIPSMIIEQLANFETDFNLERCPTTSSIWNIAHHEQRITVYTVKDLNVVFRPTCECKPGIPHVNDVHCPRNIVFKPEQSTELPKASQEGPVQTPEEKRLAKTSAALAGINAMIGLHDLKSHMSKLAHKIETARLQGALASLQKERFGTMFIGGPGTGKTAVAKDYLLYLCYMGAVISDDCKCITIPAIHMMEKGVDTSMDDMKFGGIGGIIFIDGAHNFLNDTHPKGARELDFLLEAMEKQKGRIIFVLAGHEEGMRKILGKAPGLFPNVVKFDAMSDDDLRKMLWKCLSLRGSEKVVVEGGEEGLYMRVAAKRIGRRRGEAGFDNARAVENVCAKIWERQAIRLSDEKRAKNNEHGADAKLEPEEREERTEAKSENLPCLLEQSTSEGSLVSTSTATESSKNAAGEDTNIHVSNNNLVSISISLDCETTSEDSSEQANEPTEKVIVPPKETSVVTATNQTRTEDNNELATDQTLFILTKNDILGPDPGTAALDSPAWKKLQALVGLSHVKESVLSLLHLIQANYKRELQEKAPLKLSLNRLFLGPPGVGKSVVAKLYAQLLTEIGALSKGEVITKTPADLLGKYIGHSEANTKAALKSAMGNVLVIDEAYMMHAKTSDDTDSFRHGIMDTIVSEIQSTPGEDRCVLLLGYEEPMLEMLRNGNPGLARRFPVSDAFMFQEYTMVELESILRSKLQDDMLEVTEEAITTALGVVEKARCKVNFGNGGEVENLITTAKTNYHKRMSAIPVSERPDQWILEPQDFDPAFDRIESACQNLHDLFSDVVGCEKLIEKFAGYQQVCKTLKKRGMNPTNFIPTTFVFKGPPGSGKTTTARKISKIYYDMGILADPSVVDCSVTDLIGKYVGHSGPKTRKIFESALGKVLFIDEAYGLANGAGSESSYHGEVVTEIVDLLSKPDFAGKLIVILAGYEKEMNQLLSTNPGLASRFPEEVLFAPLDAANCLSILKMKLEKAGISTKISDEAADLVWILQDLSKTSGWGNARDMETLAKSLSRDVFANWNGEDKELICDEKEIVSAMRVMLAERRARGGHTEHNSMYN